MTQVTASKAIEGSAAAMRTASAARAKLSGWRRKRLCSASNPSIETVIECRPAPSSPSNRCGVSAMPLVTIPHGYSRS